MDRTKDGRRPQTLSVWRDMESVYAFASRGRHLEAFRLRREWMVESDWPTYVAWWIEDGHFPTWPEANEHLQHLHDHGPTPFAFNFNAVFDAGGSPTTLDRARVSEVASTVR